MNDLRNFKKRRNPSLLSAVLAAAADSALCLLRARLLKMLAMCCEAAAAAAAELAVFPGSEAGLDSRGGGGGVSAAEGKRPLPALVAPSEVLNSSKILVGCDLRLLDILEERCRLYVKIEMSVVANDPFLLT